MFGNVVVMQFILDGEFNSSGNCLINAVADGIYDKKALNYRSTPD